MKTLRSYQCAAIKTLWQYIYDNKGKNPLIDAPVGSGKSLLIAEFIKQVHEKYPRTKIVMLTHVKELLTQNHQELIEQYPNADVGFYCAGLGQSRLHNDITFASIQSIHNKVMGFNRVPEIIIIDEAHLISHKGDTQYRQFIDEVKSLNPNCIVIGFTGSPFRSDTGRLDKGENALFDDVAYTITMKFMLDEGYWKRPVCPAIATKMDTTGVKVRGGEFVSGELETAVNTKEINDACVREMVELGKNRKKWLVFTVGVKHAQDVYDELIAAGVNAAVITGDTPKEERERIIKDYKAGLILCLVNVAVLTTGFNAPDIDMLVFMRPMKSPVLYIQTLGRGVRPVYADGYDLTTKEGRINAIANSYAPDCMILDFGQVVATLGAIDKISIDTVYEGEKEKEEGEPKGEAIMKICPSCGTECGASQRYCLSCGYCFINLEQEASNRAIVSDDEQPEWIDVLDMMQNHHKKKGGQPSLKVTYHTMAGAIMEWVCFEHHIYPPEDNKRFAWNNACAWHKKRRPDIPPPKSVELAVFERYPKPSRIKVKRDGKFWKILDYDFEPIQEQLIDIDKHEDEFIDIPF